MEKEEAKVLINYLMIRYLGIIQTVFVIAVVISPFLWIWGNSSLALKTALTGVLGIVITYLIYRAVKKTAIDETIKSMEDKLKESPEAPKSRFQKKLEEMKKKRENLQGGKS